MPVNAICDADPEVQVAAAPYPETVVNPVVVAADTRKVPPEAVTIAVTGSVAAPLAKLAPETARHVFAGAGTAPTLVTRLAKSIAVFLRLR